MNTKSMDALQVVVAGPSPILAMHNWLKPQLSCHVHPEGAAQQSLREQSPLSTLLEQPFLVEGQHDGLRKCQICCFVPIF